VIWLDNRSRQLGISMPKGVSAAVKSAATQIVEKFGRDMLETVAKMHFRTSAEVLEGSIDRQKLHPPS